MLRPNDVVRRKRDLSNRLVMRHRSEMIQELAETCSALWFGRSRGSRHRGGRVYESSPILGVDSPAFTVYSNRNLERLVRKSPERNVREQNLEAFKLALSQVLLSIVDSQHSGGIDTRRGGYICTSQSFNTTFRALTTHYSKIYDRAIILNGEIITG